MKIIKFEDSVGKIRYGNQHNADNITILEGNPLKKIIDTGEEVKINKLLAPIDPTDIICIGLNYRKHAEEGNSKIPEYPVFFMKNT